MLNAKFLYLTTRIFITLAIMMFSVVFNWTTAFSTELCSPGKHCDDSTRLDLLKRLDLSIGQKNYSASRQILNDLQMFNWSDEDQHKLKKLERIVNNKFKPIVNTSVSVSPTTNINDGSDKSIQPIYIGSQVLNGNLSPDAKALSGLEVMLGLDIGKPVYLSANKVISATASIQNTFRRLDEVSSSKVPNIARDEYDSSYLGFGVRQKQGSSGTSFISMIAGQYAQHYLAGRIHKRQFRVDVNVNVDPLICKRPIRTFLEVNVYRSGNDETLRTGFNCSLAQKSFNFLNVVPYIENQNSLSLTNDKQATTIGIGAMGSLGIWRKLPLRYEIGVKSSHYNYGYFGGANREETKSFMKLSAVLPVTSSIGDLVISVTESKVRSNLNRFDSQKNFVSFSLEQLF